MFERFTARARRVLMLAQDEVRRLDCNFIGTEHLLLGLIAEGDGIGGKVLTSFGVSAADVEAQVLGLRAQPGRSAEAPPKGRFGGKPPFSPKAKKVLELSLREALQLGHNYIGTEHLLLALMRTKEGLAAQALTALGVREDEVRRRVFEALKDLGVDQNASAPRRRSAAAADAIAGAESLAGEEPLTTGHLLRAMLDDEKSHAAMALSAVGVDKEDVVAKLDEIPVSDTRDAPPGSQTVEVRLGGVSTVITDADLASALRTASREEIEAALRDMVNRRDKPAAD